MYNPYNFIPNYQQNLYNNPYAPQINSNSVLGSPNANTGIIWIQGQEAAKAYPIAPNSTAVLWDSDSQTIYVKSADNSGKPSMRILEWVEKSANQNPLENINVNQAQNSIDLSGYVTRKEFDDVINRLNNLSNKINKQNNKNNQNNKEEKENA